MLPYDPDQIPASEDHGCQAEQGQQHLAPVTAELPAPGHAFILNKIQLEPGKAENVLYKTQRIMSFDPNLQTLVSNNYQQYDQYSIAKLHDKKLKEQR